MAATIGFSAGESAFRVEEKMGCIIVYGAIPIDKLVQLTKRVPKKAIQSIDASNRLGATLVMGLPEQIELLLESSPQRRITGAWLEKLGAPTCEWVETGHVGISSNCLLHTLTGFNALAWLRHGEAAAETPPDVDHPYDFADFRRCRLVLESNPDFRAGLHKMARKTRGWGAIVEHWDELCKLMDSDCVDWKEPKAFSRATSDRVRELVRPEAALSAQAAQAGSAGTKRQKKPAP